CSGCSPSSSARTRGCIATWRPEAFPCRARAASIGPKTNAAVGSPAPALKESHEGRSRRPTMRGCGGIVRARSCGRRRRQARRSEPACDLPASRDVVGVEPAQYKWALVRGIGPDTDREGAIETDLTQHLDRDVVVFAVRVRERPDRLREQMT